MPVAEAERRVGAGEHLARGDDVEHGRARDAVGMVEREPVGAAPAAIVAGDGEALEAEVRHDRDVVVGHRALGVRLVVVGGRRLGAVAVAAQIGADDRERVRQPRRDRMPHRVRLRVAVEQQQRRAAAAVTDVDGPGAGVDGRGVEAVEHAPGLRTA
jgi:hypothetical protein